jgi:hypothetical protein
VASGGGGATATTATTDADGIATVGSWTLGTTAGTNTLTATVAGLTPATFTATGVPLAPASLTKQAGDNQTALPGTNVPIAPSVLVRDQHNNPVPNATVTFAVASGGGSITGGTATTNASGVATVGSWRLGNTPGTNTLTASVSGVAAVTFTATGLDPCTQSTALGVPASVNGELTTADCELDGFLYDFYSVNMASSVMHVFSMSSTAFDTFLELWDAQGNEIFALSDDSPSSTDSRLRVLAAAGSYSVGATSFSTGSTGSYTLSAATASTDVGPCPGLDIDAMVWITRGTTTAQSLGSSDCQVGTAGSTVYADRLAVIMYAGFQYTITQTSGTFDTFLSLLDSEGTVVAANDDIAPDNSNSRIVFTPSTSDVYIIQPSSFNVLATGSYTLTVQLTGGASAARDQRVGQFPRVIARPRRK